MNKSFYFLILFSTNSVLCTQYTASYLPVLGKYSSYSKYTDNLAYIKELDHIVNYRVSKLKSTIIEITRNLYDARNYDLHSLSDEVNLKFNDFVNKMLANYSIITSMGYHFEVLLFEYKRSSMKLTKKFISQGEDFLNESGIRAMTYFTVKKLDNLYNEIISLSNKLNLEWEQLKVYITRGVSEMQLQKPTNENKELVKNLN